MVKISILKSKACEDEHVQVREVLPSVALDELILALSYRGFVEEHLLVPVEGNSKADILRISVTTHLSGPVSTPYLIVFEGRLEDEMSALGIVCGWYVRAFRQASEEVLHKELS